MKDLSASLGLNIQKTQATVQKTTTKAMKISDTYLGNKPDRQEALEFLCLAEAAEVTHYVVLRSLPKKVKAKNFGKKIKRILEEEKEHLKFCTKLVKENIVEQEKYIRYHRLVNAQNFRSFPPDSLSNYLKAPLGYYNL